MRICVFSDIHGNKAAFDAVWNSMRQEDVSAYLFLGDLCGYYPEAYAAYQVMREIPNLFAVIGNHDRMFLDIFDGNLALRKEYRERYGLAMECLLSEASQDVATWLRMLPPMVSLADGTVLGVHGSPGQPLDGYVYPDMEKLPLPSADFHFVLMGHTHYKMYRQQDGVVFSNPGSVGQPRDGGWPSYALFDTDTGGWDFREICYDRELTRRSVQRVGDVNLYLTQVLDRMGSKGGAA